MTSNVFEAQIKAVDAATGPIRTMAKGLREIIVAARGAEAGGHEAAKAAGKAGHAATKSGHAAVAAGHAAAHASHEAAEATKAEERASEHAQKAHLRYISALSVHVRLLHHHFGELHELIAEVGSSATELLPALGALGAGGSLVGLFEMTHEASEAAIAFDAVAQKAGVTAAQLAGLNWAAKESGVSTDTMRTSLERFNRTLGDSATGKNKDAAALFHHLHIALKDSAGHVRNLTEVMPELSDAFQHTSDPTMRARMAFALFGRQGQELLPVLMQGREKLEEMSKAGEKFADMGTGEAREKLKEFGHAWGEMDAAADGFKTKLATELGPALKPLVEMARDFIMQWRDPVAEGLARKIHELADALKDMNIKETVHNILDWVKSIHDATEGHWGLIAAVSALTLVLGSPLATAAKNGAGAVMLFGKSVRAITLMMMANPFLAVAVGIAAIGIAVYENWDKVKAATTSFIDSVKAHPWRQIATDSLQPFTLLARGIGDAFDWVLTKIQPVIDAMKSAGSWVQNSWIGRHLAGAAGPTVEAARAAAPLIQSPTRMRTYDDDGPPPNLYGRMYGRDATSLPTRSGDAPAQATPQDGKVKVQIDMTGAPPGTRVTSDASGIAQPPETNVGYINPLQYAF